MRMTLAGVWGLALFTSCSPLGALGVEQYVSESEKLIPPYPAITDDKIEDKHPQYDPDDVITEDFGACRVTLNKSAAVTKLDIMPFDAGDLALQDRAFRTYAEALDALSGRPTLPSMELVQAWMKAFNDGLYAAVELAAQDGSSGSNVNKQALFLDVVEELVSRSEQAGGAEGALAGQAAAHFTAALTLGGQAPPVPSSVTDEASDLMARFETEPLASQPIGFYTWSPPLEGIFRQDRFLQNEWSVPKLGPFAVTALGLRENADLAARYDRMLALYAGLTNPFYDRPVTDLVPLVANGAALSNLATIQQAFQDAHPETEGTAECAAHLAFLPASNSSESALFRDLICKRNLVIPDGMTLIDVLIGEIRIGNVDLTPGPDAGWYDRQTWALETLLVPERAPEKDHLFLTRRYKEKLVETFKTVITQNRETHAKQVESNFSMGGADDASVEPIPVDVYPKLPVEPFPTFYLRTARAYAFLENLLRTTMGDEFLASTGRVLETGGRRTFQLGEELREKIEVLYGLHVVASKSIGMRHQLTDEEAAVYEPDAAEARARSFLAELGSNTDVTMDPRVIVPVSFDADRDVMTYWALVGAGVLRTQTMFYPEHEPIVVNPGYCTFRSFVEHDPYLVVGKMVEVAIRASHPPPTRDEFRAICDAHDSKEGIKEALEAL